MSLLYKIEKHLENKLPFVAYKKKEDVEVKAFFQRDDILHKTQLNDKGFVFAPFEFDDNAILIPEESSDFVKEELLVQPFENSHPHISFDENAKKKHINIVEKGISAIHQQLFKKVVLSREEQVAGQYNPVTLFSNLLSAYPNAFVYLWYHPKVGMWLGATPETLVKINQNRFETMSLAGTQVYIEGKEIIWGSKEKDEQQLVTDYIEENLKIICENIYVGDQETVRAGSLLHLKTTISGVLRSDLKSLIKALHPTPAVCGFPTKEAKTFILHNEGYSRQFYTGFLGELNLEESSQLFVNLRCMQLFDNSASLYIGGGITKDSNPALEWEETMAKSRVIKRVL